MPDFEYPFLLSIILLKLENQINEILYLDYDEYFLYMILYLVNVDEKKHYSFIYS